MLEPKIQAVRRRLLNPTHPVRLCFGSEYCPPFGV
jgi:hypothetical protein